MQALATLQQLLPATACWASVAATQTCHMSQYTMCATPAVGVMPRLVKTQCINKKLLPQKR